MAKLGFGAWIPTYAWSDNSGGAENVRRIRESIAKCEKHGIDVWVIDHLLSAPGLYGNAWLEPLNVLSYAAALTSRVKIATGILVLPVRHPVVLAKEISTLCHLSNNRYVFGVGPGWYAREFEVTGSRIEERGRRTDEIIEAVTLLLTRPSASYRGRYYQFTDVTIDPRPPEMPDIWVSGGSRVPDPGEHDVPVIATSVMDRIVKAGHWLSRCSGTQEWVKRDWDQLRQHAAKLGRDPAALTFGHCNFTHLVETASEARALSRSKEPFLRAMGNHRSWDHLQECYMAGSIDRINARIADLVGAGLEYLVLGPVTDDPRQIDLMARRIMPNFA
ncbi:MAG TPA: LLM class flavin-dependent oxidoreductase [Candidatus Binatia bacterium]|jgi:alkanesulfonate monooxygenase|nr:LLM class flavin-dependent oxidoreductase [Candidatus Binatia bacterium]